jgi:hypothetical protein
VDKFINESRIENMNESYECSYQGLSAGMDFMKSEKWNFLAVLVHDKISVQEHATALSSGYNHTNNLGGKNANSSGRVHSEI